jgi:tetratricopeptide (TPR) repeat protein
MAMSDVPPPAPAAGPRNELACWIDRLYQLVGRPKGSEMARLAALGGTKLSPSTLSDIRTKRDQIPRPASLEAFVMACLGKAGEENITVPAPLDNLEAWQRLREAADRTDSPHTAPPGGDKGYRLEPFSQAIAVDPRRYVDQPSMLLDARSQIVPFSGREDELDTLAHWRDDDAAPVSALLLHGPGGQGKSRLAARFAEQSAGDGWDVAQARHRAAPERPEGELAWSESRGLLVIVDYADRWAHPDLVELFKDPRLAGPSVRVLLIGRTVHWWHALRGELRSVGTAVRDLLLDEFADNLTDREQAFIAARDRFGVALGVSEPITTIARGLDGDAYGQVLALHMAALVVALTVRSPGDSVPDSVEGIAAYLLDREWMWWRRQHGTRHEGEEFDTSPTVMARAVFTAILGGPLSRRGGLDLLERVGLAHADQILTDHRVCYPPRDRGQVLEPLYPDRLAEDFVALLLPGHDVTGYDPDPWAADAHRVLLGLDEPDAPVPSRVDRAVTVLASAADRWPHVGEQLGELLSERPEIAVQAGSAALVALSEARHVDTDVLLAVEVYFPSERRVDLDSGTAAVTDRLVRERVDDVTRLQDAASWYSRLGMRLINAGRMQEALRANHKGVAALDRLNELDPGTYGVPLAAAVLDIGKCLSDLGLHQQAVGFTGRAVELFRAGAAEDPTGYLPGLALALSNYGNQLQNIGQRGKAVDIARESVAIHRTLMSTELADPPRFAFALSSLGTRFLAVGQYQAALDVLLESVDTYRHLVDRAPQTHLPGLARALTNLGLAHYQLDHGDEALRCDEDAVAIRRRLVELNPAAYTADLTLSLVNLAGKVANIAYDVEAAGAIAGEAVALARRLTRSNRVAHEKLLAHALCVSGAILARSDPERAVVSLREAAALYERLVLVDDGHRPMLDATMANLRALDAGDGLPEPAAPDAKVVALFNEGVRLVKAGRPAEAEEHYRRAAEAGLPQAMFNLGHLYIEGGRTADAETWLTRAVAAGVAMGCHDLGVLHWHQGHHDEARHWFQRGADAGATNAMTSLGAVLWNDGDLAGAEHWFRVAAEAGDPHGDHRLGMLMTEQRRYAEAETHFERAAEAGLSDAIQALADHRMRHDNVGDAQHWWRIARTVIPPAPKPPPAPPPDHPLTDAAQQLGIPTWSFTPDQTVALAAQLLDQHVAALTTAGQFEEAIKAYQESVAANEGMLALDRDGTLHISSNMTHSLRQQNAVTLSNMAPLEQVLGRTEDALAHSEEATITLAALTARSGDVLPHAKAQLAFAVVRAAAGTDIERATTELNEAIIIFCRIGDIDPEIVRDDIHRSFSTLAHLLDHAGRHEEATRLRNQIDPPPSN